MDFSRTAPELDGTYVISKFDFTFGLSKVLDLVNPYLNDHHQRTALIAGSIAQELGYSQDRIERVIIASAIHDIGVIIEKEFTELLEFDTDYNVGLCHGYVGAFLIDELKTFGDITDVIKFHHEAWDDGSNSVIEGVKVPDDSFLLHLADRVDVLLDRNINSIEQKRDVLDKISAMSGRFFKPEHVEALRKLSKRESFWFNIDEKEKHNLIKRIFKSKHVVLEHSDIKKVAKILSRVIDFRCSFTASHSSGVSAVAGKLAELSGMSKSDVRDIKIAGFLHDIGKLALPAEIIYKKSSLAAHELIEIKKHTFYTYKILNSMDIFEKIKEWAAFHHEYLDGSGYPFHVSSEKLDKGSRIMTIADIFTAISENRPYRLGMNKDGISKVFTDLVKLGKIDEDLVQILLDNLDYFNKLRSRVQDEAMSDFKNFREKIFSVNTCNVNPLLQERLKVP